MSHYQEIKGLPFVSTPYQLRIKSDLGKFCVVGL